MKRALRRHHKQRMRRRAKKLFDQWGYFGLPTNAYPKDHIDKDVQYALVRRGDTFTCCSCWMCGNPRKAFKGNEGLTRQEVKQNIADKFPGDDD